MFYDQDGPYFMIRMAYFYIRVAHVLLSGWQMFYNQDDPCFMIMVAHVL